MLHTVANLSRHTNVVQEIAALYYYQVGNSGFIQKAESTQGAYHYSREPNHTSYRR